MMMLIKFLVFGMLTSATLSAHAKLEFGLKCSHWSGKSPDSEFFYSFGKTAEFVTIKGNQTLSEWSYLTLTNTTTGSYRYSQNSSFPKYLPPMDRWVTTYSLNRESLELLRHTDFRSGSTNDLQQFNCAKLADPDLSYKQNSKLLQNKKNEENRSIEQQLRKNKI